MVGKSAVRLRNLEESINDVPINIVRYTSKCTQLEIVVNDFPEVFINSQESFTARLMLRQLQFWLFTTGRGKRLATPLYGLSFIDFFVADLCKRVLKLLDECDAVEKDKP